MLNAMGNDSIQQVDVIKSARIGYTKMLLANMAYKAEHKKRKQCIFFPSDGDSKEFSKIEFDNMVRDVPCVRNIFPEWNSKSPKNTIDLKQLAGSTIYIRGGKSGKNYRRISVDESLADELDAFDRNIGGTENSGGEGTASGLMWKRTEGSAFRKMIRGSTPTNEGESLIYDAAQEAECLFRRFWHCPECTGHFEVSFGGKKENYGFKWVDGDASTVQYLCPHCGCLIENSKLSVLDEAGFWCDEKAKVITKDGLVFNNCDGAVIDTPRHVAFHPWTALSPFTTWREITQEWLDANKDPLKLKTFVNTTLGETYKITSGESINVNALENRGEDYGLENIPDGVCYITSGVDTQADRFEVQYLGWGLGKECWVLGYRVLFCDTTKESSWDDVLFPELRRVFKHPVGRELESSFNGIDTQGVAVQQAYKFCKDNKSYGMLAMKGKEGERPIIPLKPSRNWKSKGLEGWVVGADTAKTLIYKRLSNEAPGEGFIHFPDEGLPDGYFTGLTCEKRLMKTAGRSNKKEFYWYTPSGARNEPLDTFVYGLAALEHSGVDLTYASVALREGQKKTNIFKELGAKNG